MSMHFNYGQPQSQYMGMADDDFGPDFNEFDAELPGYYEARSRPANKRARGRFPSSSASFNGSVRPVRGTLPHHYSGGIRNKYSIPGQITAREEQLQQRVTGMKEKLV